MTLATGRCGLPYKNRDDLLFIRFPAGARAAGLFTRSAAPAAPVLWSRAGLRAETLLHGLVVNAGNANAATGKAGSQAARAIAQAAAKLCNCRQKQILLASTGVIGETLPPAPVIAALEKTRPQTRLRLAARAIMTTDTRPKIAAARCRIGSTPVRLCAIAKGAAMVAPNLATALAFVFTDAALSSSVLQKLLARAAENSLNAVTIDGDTSTNDTLLLFATGQGAPRVRSARDPRIAPFARALDQLLLSLARQIVRDGEGAHKEICVDVEGAASAVQARAIARAIANSPLVKTAIAGADPNWGRILMAAGKAGAKIARGKFSIAIGGISLARAGAPLPLSKSAAARLARHMKTAEIRLRFHAGCGKARARIWTCDLTRDYVALNTLRS